MRKPREYTDNDFEPQAIAALDDPYRSVLLTGRAGTGKTTLLNYWKRTRKPAGLITVAPTGIAALQAGGETIHRFCHMKPGTTVEEAYRKGRDRRDDRLYGLLRVIVMDEVSMCRADLLDALSAFLKGARSSTRPFGGVRLVMIGDPLQLPPVVTRTEQGIFSKIYESADFFNAHDYKRLVADGRLTGVNLTVVHRQNDPLFIKALNSVRGGHPHPDALKVFNRCVGRPIPPDAITLAAVNRQVDRINDTNLQRLGQPIHVWRATVSGEWPRDGKGEYRDKPSDLIVKACLGARVMMTMNDPGGLYVNGSMGEITGWENRLPVVTLDDGTVITVAEHTWEQTSSYAYEDPESGEWKVGRKTLGSYTQIPFRLAWAVTIHKSQGMTFPHVRIELDPYRSLFENGMAYVALSRCTSLDGLSLNRPIRRSDVMADPRTVAYVKHLQRNDPKPNG